MSFLRPLLVLVLLTALVAAPATASALPLPDLGGSAPVGEAPVSPGVQTVTENAGQCTANFVFTDGEAVYLGQSAHCASLEGPTSVDGCQAASLPVGTKVDIQGANHPGTLVYSSWQTMQRVGETDPNTCLFNDFALVRLHPADHDKVDPTMPVFGGPNGVNTAGTAFGETVHTYGSSPLRLGLEALSPKEGVSLGTEGGGWNHPVVTVTPGIPGDSGSGVLDAEGNALGVLSALQLAPLAGSNEVTDLGRALDYANTHTDLDVRLVRGAESLGP